MSTLEYTRPGLYPKQEAAIFTEARYGIVEASTKSGKTVGCMVWLTEQAILHGTTGHSFWWVAPTYNQAKVVYRRLKRSLPREIYTANDSELTLTFVHGAVIACKTADNPDSLYGEDVYAAVIDEATRCKEDAWYAVRSTLTYTEGPVRIIGNVKGRKNWAYKLARLAEGGKAGFHYAKITAHDAIEAKILTDEEVQDAERTLPDNIFRELYLAEPSDDQGNPFGLDAIARCIKPMSTATPVVWGWDLAKSVDWSVGCGLDEDGDVCRFIRMQEPWRETIAIIVRHTKCASLVDSTGVGDPIVEALQHGAKQNDDSNGQRFDGFKFTSGSKQQLMEGLAVAIQQERIHYPDGVITSELRSMEYEFTRTGVRYAAASGLHDDCVMALALAWREFLLRKQPMTIWGGPEDETNETRAARRQYSADEVLGAIHTDGMFWPE